MKHMLVLALFALVAAPSARALDGFDVKLRVDGVFDALTRVDSLSRTPIFRTDSIRLSTPIYNVSAVRVRGLEWCGTGVGRWGIQGMLINGNTYSPSALRFTFKSATYGTDECGSYVQLSAGRFVNISHLMFFVETLNSRPRCSRSPVVELGNVVR